MEKEDVFAAEKKNRELKGRHIMEKEKLAEMGGGTEIEGFIRGPRGP